MSISRSFTPVLALSALAGICFAQNSSAPPASPAPATVRYLVTVVQLKPDMANEWLDLRKNEVTPALKKGALNIEPFCGRRWGNREKS